MSLLGVSTTVSTGLAEGGVNVDLDLSLFVQIGFFVVLLLVLKPVLFDPMMRLFEEREKRIEGTRHEATKVDQKSAKAKAKADAIVAKGREAGAVERDTLRAEGLKREVDLMNKVRAETATTLEQGRSAIAKDAAAARKELHEAAGSLGRDMAARVLGREVSP